MKSQCHILFVTTTEHKSGSTTKMAENPLKNFFNTHSIAIFGASESEDKPGFVIAENFINNFAGKTFLLNPKGGEILGQPVYKSIMEITEPIDSAVIIVPAKYVPAAMNDCAKKGIKSVTIISGGFKEIGEDGIKLQKEIDQIAKENDIRIIGPNCIGLFYPKRGLDMVFLPEEKLKRPTAGNISILSQSGAFGSAFLDIMGSLGNGNYLSKFVSYGNASDINEADILEYFGEDPETKVILAYLEGFKEGRRFIEIARKVSLKKPIIVIKANRTEAGAKAVASHTASLAANDDVTDALFKEAGIIRAYTWDELFDCMVAFNSTLLPEGNRVLVITDGGGAGVMASDTIGTLKLELATISPEIVKKMKEDLPPYFSVSNPIDLTGSATAKEYIYSLEQTINDPQVDAITFIIIPTPPAIDVKVLMNGLKPFAKSINKTITFCAIGGAEAVYIRDEFEQMNFPFYPTPARSVYAIKKLTEYADYLRAHGQKLPIIREVPK
ncbi:MAG: CoA-binding protein [Candidatus Heimdallarchaeota archaeon]|nr:CoA-binding protein [Candidatus Heimdallarchaeota archaeon]